jgi:hypothetical protein
MRLKLIKYNREYLKNEKSILPVYSTKPSGEGDKHVSL